MKAWLVKPVRHDLSSRSSVFTPVSPISKAEISGKYPVIFYRSGILPDTSISLIYTTHPKQKHLVHVDTLLRIWLVTNNLF